MKNSIEHLPIENQIELQKIAKVCEDVAYVEKVILFGSFARGDWVDDEYVEDGITYRYQSDYDLLIVVRSEKEARHCTLNGKLERKIKRLAEISRPISTIFHGIQYLNQEIEDRSYFFYDIYNEGIMLYDTGNHILSKPQEISKRKRYKKALQYYDKWFNDAERFLDNYEYNIFQSERKNDIRYLHTGAFTLHQTTEKLFSTITLTFTDYRWKTHDLNDLFKYVRICDQRFNTAFPMQTEEEKRLFKILRDAYIDSRYKLDYSVEKEELLYLEARVKILRDLTEKICNEKIEELNKDIE